MPALSSVRSVLQPSRRHYTPLDLNGALRGRCSHKISRSTRRALATSSQGAEASVEEGQSVESYDVVIVGGGPAGLALAGALASSQPIYATTRIALIEAGSLAKLSSWSPLAGEYSNRVSSITNVSRDFLRDIGAWKHVDESRSMPVEDMQVWDGVSDARINFHASDLGIPIPTLTAPVEMARLIENLNVQRALLRLLHERNKVRLLENVKVSNIEGSGKEGDDWPHISLSDGRVLRARLLVGADGHNSPVRSFAQISSYGWSYPTHAVVATMHHSPLPFDRRNTTAYQRFLPTGPIAFLPLSPRVSSLVWSTKPELAAALKSSEPDAVRRMINAAFRLPAFSMNYLHNLLLEAHEAGVPLTASQVAEEIEFRERSHSIEPQSALSSRTDNDVGIPPLGSVDYPPLVTAIQAGSIASFPLRFMHADAYLGEGGGARTVLVGDAAHNVHPLAGQGLNMGLADVQELVQCLEQGVLTGSDIGSRTILQPYARSRYFANHSVLSVTDKLHKLYSFNSKPVVWARSVGLEVINELGSLKGAVMQGAGANSDAPRGAGVWGGIATGVEAFNLTVDTAKSALSGLGTLAGAAIGNMISNARRS